MDITMNTIFKISFPQSAALIDYKLWPHSLNILSDLCNVVTTLKFFMMRQ